MKKIERIVIAGDLHPIAVEKINELIDWQHDMAERSVGEEPSGIWNAIDKLEAEIKAVREEAKLVDWLKTLPRTEESLQYVAEITKNLAKKDQPQEKPSLVPLIEETLKKTREKGKEFLNRQPQGSECSFCKKFVLDTDYSSHDCKPEQTECICSRSYALCPIHGTPAPEEHVHEWEDILPTQGDGVLNVVAPSDVIISTPTKQYNLYLCKHCKAFKGEPRE